MITKTQNKERVYLTKYIKHFNINISNDIKNYLLNYILNNNITDIKTFIDNLKDYLTFDIDLNILQQHLNYYQNDLKAEYFNNYDLITDQEQLFITIQNDLFNKDLKNMTIEYLKNKDIKTDNFYYGIKLINDDNYILVKYFNDNYREINNNTISLKSNNLLKYKEFQTINKTLKFTLKARYKYHKDSHLIEYTFKDNSKIVIQKTTLEEYKIIFNNSNYKEITPYFRAIKSFKYYQLKRIKKEIKNRLDI